MVALENLGPGQPESLLVEQRLIELAGQIDVDNRYASAVMVKARLRDGFWTTCGGVAIGRLFVLTAGHCVCERRSTVTPQADKGTIIDSSACATAATVEAFRYLRWKEGGREQSGGEGRTYSGSIHPHPSFEVLMDGQGHVVSSRADLALIQLEKPLGEEVPTALLADEEVQVGAPVIIVGYGYDEVSDFFGSERRFCVNRVEKFLEPGAERVQVTQPGGHRYRSDSGGPCFRASTAGLELVGISSRNLGEGATFTSTYPYRDWLRKELRRSTTTP
ncbi:trypsin-like serine protease [Hyalangium versicolor]|uniref:trypsin-like serine protease n=1 Tax=Hyalangium versicolor TaxID=2861190 RepID=UPI001CCA6C5F|nr:trypsin-like serine protease [Hyalangium versicolor]